MRLLAQLRDLGEDLRRKLGPLPVERGRVGAAGLRDLGHQLGEARHAVSARRRILAELLELGPELGALALESRLQGLLDLGGAGRGNLCAQARHALLGRRGLLAQLLDLREIFGALAVKRRHHRRLGLRHAADL